MPGGWQQKKRSKSLMIRIVGTWRLVRAEAFDATGKPQSAPYGGAPIGRVMFTGSGRMMAMTGDAREQVLAGQVREYNTYLHIRWRAIGHPRRLLLESCLHGHRTGAR